MLCAACNKSVHSRCILALGKAWHTYHFVCSICRVVLQEDNYATLPDDSITCIDCLSVSNNKQTSKSTGSISQPHNHHTHSLSPTLRSASSPCLLPDTSRPTLNPLYNSFSGLTGPRGLHSDSSPSTRQDIALNSSASREIEPTIKHTFTELDPNEQYSNSKSTLFYRRLISPSSATNHTHDAYSSAPSLSVYREQSPNAPAQLQADDSTQNTKSTQNTDESKASEDNTDGLFSSDFYKSYHYRKSYSLNNFDREDSTPPTPATPIFSSTNSLIESPSTLADKTINREKRLSRKSRHSIETRPIEMPPSDSTNESESVFSDSFYKKSYQVNKKFDFEFIDKTVPPPIESFQATSEDSKSANNTQKSLPEDPTSLAEILLDTSEDMKARGRLWTSSTHRKPPPSMSIRVSVPMPYFRKPEPVATPPPAPSPSPPLSLPASPSPPPNAISSGPLPLNTPPSSPHLSRKPQQGYGLQPNPPLSNPVPILSRSSSPPLSLPEEANGKDLAQNMTARIEEEIVRLVMERVQLGSSSDMDKGASVASVGGGASSSSLMARKRRLKQAHKEATLQRQLSLHKGLVTEVLATNLKLRKVTIGSGAKSSRQELADAIRAFPLASLRKSKLVKYEDSHMIHMRNIRCFERSGKLKQVVGNTTASQLLPIVNYLVWIGKNCVGMSFRDIQYLLRDPVACRDLCSRLALRYRGTSADDDNTNKAKNADVGEVDCIVAVPHEAAIAFGARLSAQLRIPLQVLLQRHSKSSSQSSFTNKSNNSNYGSNSSSSSSSTAPMFPSGRGLYGVGVESLQTRGEAYELWLARSHCIRRDYRALVIDDVLDNGAPLVAAMMILRAAGARVVEMVTVVEYNGFGGRERVAQTCMNTGEKIPNIHSCLYFNDNDIKSPKQ